MHAEAKHIIARAARAKWPETDAVERFGLHCDRNGECGAGGLAIAFTSKQLHEVPGAPENSLPIVTLTTDPRWPRSFRILGEVSVSARDYYSNFVPTVLLESSAPGPPMNWERIRSLIFRSAATRLSAA